MMQIIGLLGVSENLAEVLIEIFPRETSAKFSENLENLDLKINENAVDANGNLIFGGKLFVGGKANSNEKNNSLLAFKRELRELKSQSENLSEEIESNEIETEKARKILAENENEIVDLQSLIVKVERELLSLEIQEKSIKQEIERAERHKKVVGEETKQIETELEQIRQKQNDAKTNAEKAEKRKIFQRKIRANLAKIKRRANESRRRKCCFEREKNARGDFKRASAFGAKRSAARRK